MTLKLLALSLLGLVAFVVAAIFAAGVWLITRAPRSPYARPRAHDKEPHP